MRPVSRIVAGAFAACTFSAGFYVLTAILLRRWLRASPIPRRDGFEPVTFFRPIKSGEPHLDEDLARFLGGLEPGDQVLIGTDNEKDLGLCKTLVAKCAVPDATCLHCVPDLHENPKVSKLARMESLARHERWIILDSDTRPDRLFLQGFRSEWEASGADALSSPYAFSDWETRAARLDAIGTSLSLWPGAALLRAVGRVDFLTGACMGIKAPFLRSRGGWRILGSALADDYELGRLVRQAGGRIHLASTCLSLRAGKMDASAWFFHQHRTFATFRICNPWGSLGLPLTHGVAVSFVLALGKPRSLFRWAFHALLLALRMACGNSLPSAAPRPRPACVWLVSLLEPVFWLSSWLFPRVRWGGKNWNRPKKIPIDPRRIAP